MTHSTRLVFPKNYIRREATYAVKDRDMRQDLLMGDNKSLNEILDQDLKLLVGEVAGRWTTSSSMRSQLPETGYRMTGQPRCR